jgi:molybdenum cofactor cytidylyltransferase
MVVGAVLAAGAGRRFGAGATKQLARFRGRPLIEWPLAALTGAPRVDRVLVVLGHHAEQIRAEAELGEAEILLVPGWREGQSASLGAALEAVGAEATALVVLLGDQPLVNSAAVERVVEASQGGRNSIRAIYRGVPGHPVLIAACDFDAVGAVRGDRGGQEALARRGVQAVDCTDLGSSADVDTPTELRKLDQSPWVPR